MARPTVPACSMALLLSLLVAGPLPAGKFNRELDVGDPAPRWRNLMGTDDKLHSRSDYADAEVLVLAFTSNHCPVAKVYENRFIEFSGRYRDRGVAFVAINVNTIPADRLDKMKQRAAERDFNFDYLYDPSQQTGRRYGATVTPHLFVLDEDRRIAYMGAFDDNMDPAKVRYHYVRDAVEALLDGRTPEVTESRQSGCAIQYEDPAEIDVRPVDRDGYDAVLEKYRGRVVLVDFWATWCIPCVKRFPRTVELHRKYRDEGLTVLSMSLDDPDAEPRVLEFLRENRAAFPHLMSESGASPQALEAFEVEGGALPHYKLYDRQGKLVREFSSLADRSVDHAAIETAVRETLGIEDASR